MRMNYTKWILLCTAIASIAMAGVTRVPSGPVTGKWFTGDSVIVEAGAFVPVDGELSIDCGVGIFFEGIGRFEVEGSLLVEGNALLPVNIYAVDGWRGIRLSGNHWHSFHYVNILSNAGLPRQCVELRDGGLDMRNCNFSAAENCLRVISGELHAIENSLFTSKLYSKVVELSGMNGFPSEDCMLAPGNVFRDNFLKCDVAPLQPGDPIDPFSVTSGLWVDYCTNICMNSNEITVRAPLTVVGARFGNTPDFGDQSWDLDETVVYAESFTQMAIGVLNEVNGDLDVSQMTITVRGAEGYSSSCFFAARTAYIRVNSTTTIMGSPLDIFFNTSGAGRIDANYLLKWAEAGSSLLDEDPSVPPLASTELLTSFDNLTVNLGDSIWEENPQFAMNGTWGNWNNRVEIAAFFALTRFSSCIDRGDPDLGQDPDNTRLDIGRFYFDQTSSPVDPRPGVVDNSTMLPAYPNPFNPNTILPIQVAGVGLLKVTVWDVLGRVVWEANQPVYSAGLQNVHFKASGLASGTYIAQAEFDGQIVGNQRLSLIK